MSAADGRVLLAHLLMTASVAAEKVLRVDDRTNVETVIVAGKVRKWKGRLLDVDLPVLRRQLEDSRDRVFNAAGFDTTAPGTWLTGATLIRVASRIMI
jgi:hypothetical protein